jgi:hypothetical protein
MFPTHPISKVYFLGWMARLVMKRINWWHNKNRRLGTQQTGTQCKTVLLLRAGSASSFGRARLGEWPTQNLCLCHLPTSACQVIWEDAHLVLISARSRTTAITGAAPSPVAGSDVWIERLPSWGSSMDCTACTTFSVMDSLWRGSAWWQKWKSSH